MKLIGIQTVDYTNKNGYHVVGYKLHTSIPAKTNDCIGEITDSIYVSEEVYASCDQLAVGDEIDVVYNKYGKAIGVTVIG